MRPVLLIGVFPDTNTVLCGNRYVEIIGRNAAAAVGFKPTDGLLVPSPVFNAGAFGRSATPPLISSLCLSRVPCGINPAISPVTLGMTTLLLLSGAPERYRTPDQLLTKELLYHLSYGRETEVVAGDDPGLLWLVAKAA